MLLITLRRNNCNCYFSRLLTFYKTEMILYSSMLFSTPCIATKLTVTMTCHYMDFIDRPFRYLCHDFRLANKTRSDECILVIRTSFISKNRRKKSSKLLVIKRNRQIATVKKAWISSLQMFFTLAL